MYMGEESRVHMTSPRFFKDRIPTILAQSALFMVKA